MRNPGNATCLPPLDLGAIAPQQVTMVGTLLFVTPPRVSAMQEEEFQF